jgi:hypothetical protein
VGSSCLNRFVKRHRNSTSWAPSTTIKTGLDLLSFVGARHDRQPHAARSFSFSAIIMASFQCAGMLPGSSISTAEHVTCSW